MPAHEAANSPIIKIDERTRQVYWGLRDTPEEIANWDEMVVNPAKNKPHSTTNKPEESQMPQHDSLRIIYYHFAGLWRTNPLKKLNIASKNHKL
ncbi:hypothetical protein [Aeromonas hydrophila]|uniref:hypothetical protein n=1 Tax=Aeromonas hydrophila TaxID=644 RepID=UPI002B47366A|nr:hypothetical protein [Aeromonas hydrophila]